MRLVSVGQARRGRAVEGGAEPSERKKRHVHERAKRAAGWMVGWLGGAARGYVWFGVEKGRERLKCNLRESV